MKVTPLDLRQTHFRKGLRGYDPEEVRALLTDAADDYEAALRDLDRLRQDMQKAEAQLAEYRDREANLRNTLLTAQKVADQIRENAAKEADVLMRDADSRATATLRDAETRSTAMLRDAETRSVGLLQDAECRADAAIKDATLRTDAMLKDAHGRVDMMMQKAHARLDELDHAVSEMRLRKRDVEGTLEQSIASLTYALEFVRTQDQRDEKVRMHRPRLNDAGTSTEPARTAGDAEARLG